MPMDKNLPNVNLEEKINIDETSEIVSSSLQFEEELIKISPKKNSLKVILFIFIPLVILICLAIFLFKIKKNETISNKQISNVNNAPKITIINIASESATLNQKLTQVVINEGEIVYSNLGQLYIYDTNKGESKLLPFEFFAPIEKDKQTLKRPNNPVFSPDGKYLYFSYLDDKENHLVFYDFENHGIINNKDFGINASPAYFSPNSKYVILDSGSGPGSRSRTLVTVDGEKKIANYGGYGVLWQNNSSKFILGIGGVTLDAVPTGPSPQNLGVKLITLENDEVINEKILIKGDYQNSYRPIKWLDDKNILIQQEKYSEVFPEKVNDSNMSDSGFMEYWMDIYNNPETNYWQLNIDTLEKTADTSYVSPEKKKWDRASYSSSKEWKVFVEGKWPNRQIFISKVDDSDKKQIAEGDEVVWRPSGK
jgi:hypothetical protein